MTDRAGRSLENVTTTAVLHIEDQCQCSRNEWEPHRLDWGHTMIMPKQISQTVEPVLVEVYESLLVAGGIRAEGGIQ